MLPRSFVFWVALVLGGCGWRGWTGSIAINERTPLAKDLLAYPEDGQTVAVNPPGFCWTPNEKAKRYRLEIRETSGLFRKTVLSSEPQSSTVYPPFRTLSPGEYQWQVIYLDENNRPAGRSKARSFLLPSSAPELRMPDIAALKARLASVRPRMFLFGERLTQIRESVEQGGVPSWERLRQAADAALEEKSYPEPEPYRKGLPSSQEWLRTFTPGKVGSAHLIRTALAYVITSDPKYLEGARRWMMTLASWDPKGITSHGLRFAGGTGNDEASMPILERMSFAWDWIGDQLTPAERAKVIEVITERGNQVLRRLEAQDFLSDPFDNHSGRVIAFLGEAGLSFLGDIPDAERWLDYVLRCYLTSYPGWGGDAGGWSQGMSYWSFYVYGHTNFLRALRQLTATDLFLRPFYRATGYLPVYFHPPYAPMGAFGDGGYHPPNEVEGVLTRTLAEVFRDPVLGWQADGIFKMGEKNTTTWREWFTEDVFETLQEGPITSIGTQSPAGMDGSRYLPDIGWVAMHSVLGDAARDVWALFKSSRFGSYSHSHADQNTFQLYAYGRALAIDSGYYPSYGTPHDNLWTRQTRAHNGILVNGRGQPPFTWEASGRIAHYEKTGSVTLVRGEAGDAYNLPQPPSLARMWEKSLGEPLPSMEPKVEAFERTLAFVGSRDRPLLVVQDYLRTSAPTRFDWLLHALNRMETDSRDGSVFVRDGDARLKVRLVATVPYTFAQTSKFPIQPEFASNTAYVLGKPDFPDQWHLSATTDTPAREMKFLAILVPYRASETEPEFVPLKAADSVGFRVAGTEVTAWWGAGRTGKIVLPESRGDGRVLLRITTDNKQSTVVAP